jgi:glutamate synthase (NADPH/NADH) small chain
MPADREEVVESREEGTTVNPGWAPQRIEIAGDEIKGLHVAQCLSLFDAKGMFNPQCNLDNRNFFEGTMIVESIGQGMDLSYLTGEISEKLVKDARGRIKVDKTFQSSIPWLFFGGDIIQGPDVIHGIANGHQAARGIDRFLLKNSGI